MGNYVVGDIQGCFDSLIALLDKVSFDPDKDTLYCVGDLINRGPKSAQTLQYLASLGKSVKTVLGNHDLHFISCYYGVRKFKKTDTAKQILDVNNAEELVFWLRQQPLMLYDEKLNIVISHAGLYPNWTIQQGLKFSEKFEDQLKSDKLLILLNKMYGNKPDLFTENLSESEQWLFTVNTFTRMRYCYDDGRLDFIKKGKPAKNKKIMPWFKLPNNRPEETRFIFGHWSTLGLYQKRNIIGIDTGCVWGGMLTIYDVDNHVFIQQRAID